MLFDLVCIFQSTLTQMNSFGPYLVPASTTRVQDTGGNTVQQPWFVLNDHRVLDCHSRALHLFHLLCHIPHLYSVQNPRVSETATYSPELDDGAYHCDRHTMGFTMPGT